MGKIMSTFSPARSTSTHLNDVTNPPMAGQAPQVSSSFPLHVTDVQHESERKIMTSFNEIRRVFEDLSSSMIKEAEDWQRNHELLKRDNQKLAQDISAVEAHVISLDQQLRELNNTKQILSEKLEHVNSDLSKLNTFQESIMQVTRGSSI